MVYDDGAISWGPHRFPLYEPAYRELSAAFHRREQFVGWPVSDMPWYGEDDESIVGMDDGTKPGGYFSVRRWPREMIYLFLYVLQRFIQNLEKDPLWCNADGSRPYSGPKLGSNFLDPWDPTLWPAIIPSCKAVLSALRYRVDEGPVYAGGQVVHIGTNFYDAPNVDWIETAAWFNNRESPTIYESNQGPLYGWGKVERDYFTHVIDRDLVVGFRRYKDVSDSAYFGPLLQYLDPLPSLTTNYYRQPVYGSSMAKEYSEELFIWFRWEYYGYKINWNLIPPQSRHVSTIYTTPMFRYPHAESARVEDSATWGHMANGKRYTYTIHRSCSISITCSHTPNAHIGPPDGETTQYPSGSHDLLLRCGLATEVTPGQFGFTTHHTSQTKNVANNSESNDPIVFSSFNVIVSGEPVTIAIEFELRPHETDVATVFPNHGANGTVFNASTSGSTLEEQLENLQTDSVQYQAFHVYSPQITIAEIV